MVDNKIDQYAAFISGQIDKSSIKEARLEKEIESVNEAHPGMDEPEYHSDKVDEITKKIEKINRSGGRVGPNHPLSQKLSYHMGELKRTRAKKRREMDEEVYQIDELKKSTLGSYINKAAQSKSDAESKMSNDQDWDDMSDKEQDKTVRDQKNRTKGIGKAVDKLTKEEADVKFSEAEVNAIENIIDNDQIDEKSMGPKAKPGQYDHIDPMRPKNTGTTRLIHPAPPKAKPGEEKHTDPAPSKAKPGEGKHIDPTSSKKPGNMDKITPMKQPAFNTKHYKEDNVSFYAQFISKQLVGEGVETLSESLAKATKAIEKMDGDAIM